MMKKITLIRGLPGSGKTTFAKKMCEDLNAEGGNCTWLESSMYVTETGIRFESPKQVRIISDWLYEKVSDAIKTYDNVIIARVASDERDIRKFEDIAKRNSAEFVVYRLDTHWEDKCPKFIFDEMKKAVFDWPDEIVIS